MTKSLNGKELQEFIKVRQLRQVRHLRQAYGVIPKLVIITSESASDASNAYVKLKQSYADDVFIEVEVRQLAQDAMAASIEQANHDPSVQGIIVQLPLADPTETDALCDLIAPEKDVDGLGKRARYMSATAQAIDWLLAGYDVGLEGKRLVIVGQGKLVGAPLARMWRERGLQVETLDDTSENTREILRTGDVIVTATGVPRLIGVDDIMPGAVVVDAGTASENGKLVGDIDERVHDRMDITITPARGGVGPLTIAVLFDHVIEACMRQAGQL